MTGGLLSLKWNNHQSTFLQVLSSLCLNDTLSDVTLACEGEFYAAHKLVLSVCSEYFEKIFERIDGKHPVIVLKDINSEELEALLSYMYEGEVNVDQEKLAGLIKAADYLKIKGLSEADESPEVFSKTKSKNCKQKGSSEEISMSPRPKRKRLSSEISDSPLIIDTPAVDKNVPMVEANFIGPGNDLCIATKEEVPELESSSMFEQSEEFDNSFVKEESDLEDDHTVFNCAPGKEYSKDVMPDSLLQSLPFESKDVNISYASEEGNSTSSSLWGLKRRNSHDTSLPVRIKEEVSDNPKSREGEHILITPDDVTSMISEHDSEEIDINRVYSCTFCTFETRVKKEYETHEHTHQIEKTFFCDFCSYSCNTKSNLKCHVRRHTGEKPYACPHCNYRSAQSSNIKIHVKRMHKNAPGVKREHLEFLDNI